MPYFRLIPLEIDYNVTPQQMRNALAVLMAHCDTQAQYALAAMISSLITADVGDWDGGYAPEMAEHLAQLAPFITKGRDPDAEDVNGAIAARQSLTAFVNTEMEAIFAEAKAAKKAHS